MTKRGKMWEWIFAETARECAKAPMMNGEMTTRQLTAEELEHYKELAKRNRTTKKYFKLQGGF